MSRTESNLYSNLCRERSRICTVTCSDCGQGAAWGTSPEASLWMLKLGMFPVMNLWLAEGNKSCLRVSGLVLLQVQLSNSIFTRSPFLIFWWVLYSRNEFLNTHSHFWSTDIGIRRKVARISQQGNFCLLGQSNPGLDLPFGYVQHSHQ